MNIHEITHPMLKLNHKKLEVWKRSIELVKEIYRITKHFPENETYGLVSQIRRAAVSITSNIAEGSARKSNLERVRFYEIARSSLVEIDTQIYISTELNYLQTENIITIERLANEVFAMLSRMIKSVQ